MIAGVVAFFALFSYVRAREARGPANDYWAYFSDASGLAPKSEVRVAGVPIGRVEDIQLEDGKAKVILSVRRDIDVYPNASVAKTSSSILGDYLIDLDPGFSTPIAEPGTPRAMTSPMPPGSRIRNVKEAVSMEELVESLSEVTRDVRRITASVNDLLTREKGSIRQILENVEGITEQIQRIVDRSSGKVDVILDNAEVISWNVREITTGKDEVIEEILANARQVTEDAKRALHAFRGVVGEEGEEGMAGTFSRLDRSITHLESIVAKIDRGEGTVGKLVSDERLGEKVSLAVEGVSDYISRLESLRTELALRTEYLFRAEAAKNYVSLRLIPAPDKYFLVEIVDDPLGFVRRELVVRSPPGETEVANQEVRTTSDVLKFSVEIAKRYSFFTLRFGLIESTGGFGFDFHVFNDRLEFKTDFFDFARPEADFPRVRALANLYVIPHLYVSAGMDDIFNPGTFDVLTRRFRFGRDFFAGGGIYFTDEDLKVLFGTISSGLP